MQPLWDRERRRKICERVGSWEHLFSTTPIYFHNYREQKKTDPSILELFFSRFLGVLETPNQSFEDEAQLVVDSLNLYIYIYCIYIQLYSPGVAVC